MPSERDLLREGRLNIERCEKVELDIIKILNGADLSLRELLYVLAKVIIDIGGSLEENTPISREDIIRRYMVEPTLGNTMLALGSDILFDWIYVNRNDNSERKKND